MTGHIPFHSTVHHTPPLYIIMPQTSSRSLVGHSDRSSGHAVSCCGILCHAVSCCVMRCHVLSLATPIDHLIMLCHAMSCCVMFSHWPLRSTIWSCCAMLCHAVSYSLVGHSIDHLVMLCHAVSCCVMLCHAASLATPIDHLVCGEGGGMLCHAWCSLTRHRRDTA